MDERDLILQDVRKAVDKLGSTPAFSEFVPEVRCNIVYSLPCPRTKEDVAAVDGRITIVNGAPKACGDVKFGASRHLSAVILALNASNIHGAQKRACINIRFTEALKRRLEAFCERNGLTLGHVDRGREPPEIVREEGRSLPWVIGELLGSTGGKAPDFYYTCGGVGKEDMIICLGDSATGVVADALGFLGLKG